MVALSLLCLQLSAVCVLTVNGYVLDRWPYYEIESAPSEDLIRIPVRRSVNLNLASSEDSSSLDKSYTKKSQQLSYKALKKFGGSGSRNCFFTPIQCMIQHDMSKYKKLVDGSRVQS